ncbi:hypothetical protein TVAG_189080 [Trichomonas vaginalis G3]|uniref:Uncharacterized protein n=1 Tax=Trichomonas vaginalis (strain ATCC PRA-98 / G3) TaxID=412133 RepID=A2F328_TRIV3|nr:hypothetical protein TVAGG3_0762210 [Trichomonas vaginalis G3]EAY00692.1 hypothetical protein TVAG_189080 [Trichomonas vaginalis G3]KAI5513280.1 hypothetical protein TVAGG3_0762210 [Trichomonas vaginalis G3]|eukprot:XP_001313621.1 hypothetical protein [Trichomonas vaginalis G3]
MSSIFQAFTLEEVESIRSVVLIGQQNDDMLLTNCTHRPLSEAQAFIKRFKKNLLDIHVESQEISDMANQQYVAIITAARAKKSMHANNLSSTNSIANLTLPFANAIDSLPLKFRMKFSKIETETEASSPKPPIPTRSKSVTNGMNKEIEVKPVPKIQIPVIPPSDFKFLHSVKDASEITPGDLAAVLKNREGPTIICRVIALKTINGIPHALVASFLNEIGPCYFPLHHLVMLRSEADTFEPGAQILTVDKLVKKIMLRAQSVVLAIEDIPGMKSGNSIKPELRKNMLYQTLACAAQLQLLNFIASWEIPESKMEILLREVEKMFQAKFKSTEETNLRCQTIFGQILEHVK